MTAAGAVVAILTDSGGSSLTGGLSVLFSFIALGFVAKLDYAFGTIFVGSELKKQSLEYVTEMKLRQESSPRMLKKMVDAEVLAQEESDAQKKVILEGGKVVGEIAEKKIERRLQKEEETQDKSVQKEEESTGCENRIIALLLALLVILESLFAEHLMASDLVLSLRFVFFQHPTNVAVTTRGSLQAQACNQLYQSVLVLALLAAFVLSALSRSKLLKKCTAIGEVQGLFRGLKKCKVDAFLKGVFVFFFDLAFITLFWWIFAVLVGGELMLSGRL